LLEVEVLKFAVVVEEDLDQHFEVIEEVGHVLERNQTPTVRLKFVDHEKQTNELESMMILP